MTFYDTILSNLGQRTTLRVCMWGGACVCNFHNAVTKAILLGLSSKINCAKYSMSRCGKSQLDIITDSLYCLLGQCLLSA